MHYQSTILSTLLLLFVTQAYSANLMCYVCDDCAKISTDTPLLACDADYFSSTGTTASSTATTESTPTSTEMMTETSTDTTTDTTTTATVITDSTASTEKPMPTPPTIGPVETTSAMPTPPEEDLIAMEGGPVPLNATHEVVTTLLSVPNTSTTTTTAISTTSAPVATENATTTTTDVSNSTIASEFSIRQVRSLVDTDVTYHCFSVQKNVNGSQITQRGCSRVTTMEAVCKQLQDSNEGVKLSKCNPCSMSKCNGSSALSVSLLTLIVAAVAGFLSRN